MRFAIVGIVAAVAYTRGAALVGFLGVAMQVFVFCPTWLAINGRLGGFGGLTSTSFREEAVVATAVFALGTAWIFACSGLADRAGFDNVPSAISIMAPGLVAYLYGVLFLWRATVRALTDGVA
jgi:hypothetical protein